MSCANGPTVMSKAQLAYMYFSHIPRNEIVNTLLDFYDRMTVHRNRFLVNKTKRCTGIKFYWYYDSTCFGRPFCPSSGFLSRTSALVHFMQI